MAAHPRTRHWHRNGATLLILSLGLALSGCVVVPVHPGFCYFHPYRCR